MKQTRIYLIIVAALLPLLWACNDPIPCDECKLHKVTISLTTSVAPETRTSQPSPCLNTHSELKTQNFPLTRTLRLEGETRINSVQLYIFNNEGDLLQRITGIGGEYKVILSDGCCTFYCFVNAPELPVAPSSSEELLKCESFLWNNSRGSFQMSGSATADIDSDMELEIVVQRMVAKVECIVRTEFGNSHLAEMPFTLHRIYLTNVTGKNNYALTAMQGDEGLWYNKMEYQQSSCDNLICGSLIDRRMNNKDSLAIDDSLYPYPNSSTDCFDLTTWSARKTRLVIEATLGEKLWYYPVTLEETISNTHYLYDITITREGVSHPEEPVTEPGALITKIKINEWNEGGEIDDDV
jgi:hypothetical protein